METCHFFNKSVLSGYSARFVVTMYMPTIIYRWYFRANRIEALERNLLGTIGIASVDETFTGWIRNMNPIDAAKPIAGLNHSGNEAE